MKKYDVTGHSNDEKLQATLDEYFSKYSDNMASILDYIQYKKDLHGYCQEGFKVYRMIPYIKDAIDTTLLIKLYGFFDTGVKKGVGYGLPLKNFLAIVKDSEFDKDNAIATFESELESFLQANAVLKNSIINLRQARAHVNPIDNLPNIAVEEVEVIVNWIKDFINKLHKLCKRSGGGYLYERDIGNIYMDVLDALKEKQVNRTDKYEKLF